MVKISVETRRGQLHEKNEDRIMVQEHVRDAGNHEFEISKSQILLAVADGVGGRPGGDVASQSALEAMAELSGELSSENAESQIRETLQKITKRINEISNEQRELLGMGTTLSGVCIFDDELLTFNLGNSRVYRFRGDSLYQLTHDDSLVQELIDRGVIGHDQRTEQQNRHIITKCIDGIGGMIELAIERKRVKFNENDILMLCTDGISDTLTIDQMESILEDSRYLLKEKCALLIEEAVKFGSVDDISVILAEKHEEG